MDPTTSNVDNPDPDMDQLHHLLMAELKEESKEERTRRQQEGMRSSLRTILDLFLQNYVLEKKNSPKYELSSDSGNRKLNWHRPPFHHL